MTPQPLAASQPPLSEDIASGGDVFVLPASFAQQRLWFIHRLDPSQAAYNIVIHRRLRGPLDVPALQRALQAVARRHEVLRTTFRWHDGGLVQVIAPEPAVRLTFTDLAAPIGLEQGAEPEAEARRLSHEHAHHAFDLEHGPLLAARLLRLSTGEHILLLTMHHIVFDGWSTDILLNELGTLYAAFVRGEDAALPELPIQYADYAVWQRDHLPDRLADQLAYWKRQLHDVPVLDLPTDQPRPPAATFTGRVYRFEVSPALSARLRQVARREQATPFMLLLAAFTVLLYRYTGQDDVAVGTPVAGRTRAELDGLIGFFVNTLVIRTNLAGGPSFRVLLARVREAVLEAQAHQDVPFEQLVETLHPQRSPNRSPLFDVMFTYREATAPTLAWGGVTVHPFPVELHAAKFDLTCGFAHEGNGFVGELEYNTHLFAPATIERMAEHLRVLLDAIAADPDQAITTLPLLTDAERHHLLVACNATQTDYPRQHGIPQLFEQQAQATPEAVAVKHGARRLTYRELDRQANRWAHRLQALGVRPGSIVGVLLERSVETVVSMLAVVKAGGAYLPLDPAHPAERLRFMLDDSGAGVVLTRGAHRRKLEGLEHLHMIDLDADDRRALPTTPLSGVDVAPEDPAYVIYTSGSTGRPKGVVILHRGVVRLVKATTYITFRPDDVVAHVSNTSFDAATFEIWGALLNGACLAVFDAGVALSAKRLARQVRADRVSVMLLTTSLFNAVAREAPGAVASVSRLVTGGEAADPVAMRAALRANPGLHLVNAYGPTECTVIAAAHHVDEVATEATTVPIGWPIANTEAYVLDRHLNPVPVGVPGELYLGGDGLALGYLHRPELTAEAFIPHPFSDAPGARLYKTGDRVRRLPDDTLVFLGRTDRQVKLRGFRVEPGEVEAALAQHPDVAACAVVVWQRAEGDARLVAYVVSKAGRAVDAATLRAHLEAWLPAYMVPSHVERLDALPLTPHGKLDRRALPEPAAEAPPDGQAAPRDPVEARLVAIWERVLDRRPIGIHDDFFDVGGHSLLAVQVFAEIEKTFGRELPISTLFQARTVEKLAQVLRQEQAEDLWSSLVVMQPSGTKPPLYCVHGVGSEVVGFGWLARRLGSDQPVYGVQGDGLDGRPIPHTTIEQMAARYADEIDRFQPDGPLMLTGFCLGSLVALAVAHELRRRGREIALLILIDVQNPRWRRQVRNGVTQQELPEWQEHLQKVREEGPRYLVRKVRQNVAHRLFYGRRQLYYVLGRLHHSVGRPIPYRLRSVYINKTYLRIIRAYRPAPYDGPVVLFRSSVNEHPDPALGWGSLMAQLKVIQIEGDHHLLRGNSAVVFTSQLEQSIADFGLQISDWMPEETSPHSAMNHLNSNTP